MKKSTKQIISFIQEYEDGKLFTYNDLGVTNSQFVAVSKMLSRLVKKGEISRLTKGVFYKPKRTKYGLLRPSEQEIIDLIIRKKLNSKGYVTGINVYNKIGLTTQVSNVITISTPNNQRSISLENLEIKISYRKGFIAPSNVEDIALLQLLDAITDFKKIPDRDDYLFAKIVQGKIMSYDARTLKRLLELSLEYPPRTKALLGAILELSGFNESATTLKLSLNMLTMFKLNINKKVLPNKNDWNIL